MTAHATQRIAMGQEVFAGSGLRAAGCAHCQRAHLVPEASFGEICPSCGQGTLEPQPVAMLPRPPELVEPFGVDEGQLKAALTKFADATWLREPDLNGQALMSRMQRVWVPVWLVDAQVGGHWQAQAGFNYEVQSTIEKYKNGQWRTDNVTETRIRWEPRVGQLSRRYDNVKVSALRTGTRRLAGLGELGGGAQRAFRLTDLGATWVALPELSPDDVWEAAREQLQRCAADDCQRAAIGDHLREFYLAATYDELHWTWLLLPMAITWYKDAQGKRHLIRINGRTGALSGPRYASSRRGWMWAGGIVAVAFAVACLSALVALASLAFAPLLLLGAVGVVAAFALGLLALWPALHPWRHNSTQRRLHPALKALNHEETA